MLIALAIAWTDDVRKFEMKSVVPIFPFLLLAAMNSAAFAQSSSTQPTALPTTQATTLPTADSADPLLGKLFRSRTAGIQFNPPAGGSMIRELNTGDIVRFIYSDQGWDIRAKPVPLHIPLMLSSPPDAGVLELTATHLTDSNPTAKILRQEVVSIHGHDVGRIEATYKAGTDHLFAQQALFRESSKYFLSLQMLSQDSKDFNRDRAVFDRMLNTVEILDRNQLAQEQKHRILETRALWVLLDQKTLAAAIQPLHFMRVVRDGRDVGFIQVNERLANHNGYDGIEVIVHSRVQPDKRTDAPAANPIAPADPTGIVIPRPLSPDAGPTTRPLLPQDLYTYSTYFMTFDRDHEDWTTITQTDRDVAHQLTESAYTDRTIKRRLDPARVAHTSTTQHFDNPPVIEIPKYVLDVSYSVGKRDQPPKDLELPPFYLPQALGQLLPRLLPPDRAQYMFAFYVSSERNLMGRYVDVGSPQEVDLDGQTVRAIPISDRIGIDGSGTTHYVTRQGEWLGSVSDDARLQVLPTDEHTLKGLWPGFAAASADTQDNPADDTNTLAPPVSNP